MAAAVDVADEGPIDQRRERTLMGTIKMIAERLEELPPRQQALARLVAGNPEMVAFGSARELAARVNLNASTVVRFAQALGFSGFNALQSAVRHDYLQNAGLLAPRDRATLEGPAGAIGAIQNVHVNNITLAYDGLRSVDYGAISNRIITARKTFVCADGTPEMVAHLFVRLLKHVGLHAEFYPSSGIDSVIEARTWDANDVLVIIGLWLTFRSQVEALTRAREAGVTTIAITGTAGSVLADGADFSIVVPAGSVSLPFSIVATSAIVEALVSHIAASRPEQTDRIEQDLLREYSRRGMIA